MPRHPNEVLFEGEKPFPIIPTCEHFAGTEERITKALELQNRMGGSLRYHHGLRRRRPHRRRTRARRDGRAHAEQPGQQAQHVRRPHPRLHERALEAGHRHHRRRAHRRRVAYITIPKTVRAAQARGDDRLHPHHDRAKRVAAAKSRSTRSSRRTVPCARSGKSPRLTNVQVLDFGMMDFVSAHNGAIPAVRYALAPPVRSQAAPARARPRWWPPPSPTVSSPRTTSRSNSKTRTSSTETRSAPGMSSASSASGASTRRRSSPSPAPWPPATTKSRKAEAILLKAVRRRLGPHPARRQPPRPRHLPLLLAATAARPHPERGTRSGSG